VVSFTPLPLNPWYPLDRRLGGPQSRSGPYRDLNSGLSVVQPVASRYTDCAIPAPRVVRKNTQRFGGTYRLHIQTVCASETLGTPNSSKLQPRGPHSSTLSGNFRGISCLLFLNKNVIKHYFVVANIIREEN
jgi:hypothetical protein